MLHEPHKTCKSSSLTQGCLICWRLVLSPGAAVGCRARFRPLSPSARTQARGCTLNRRQPSRARPGCRAGGPRHGAGDAHVHEIPHGTAVPLCTLGLRKTLPHSGSHGDMVCLVFISNGSFLQVLSCSQGFPAHWYYSAWLHPLNP